MKAIRIGFTGTQHGMTVEQKTALEAIFIRLRVKEFHHGDCIGADEEAHEIARGHTDTIVIHPPDKDDKRAFCTVAKVNRREPKPYLKRNEDIVRESDLLIAAPYESTEKWRSGTWATVRYARRARVSLMIIQPDGFIVTEKGLNLNG